MIQLFRVFVTHASRSQIIKYSTHLNPMIVSYTNYWKGWFRWWLMLIIACHFVISFLSFLDWWILTTSVVSSNSLRSPMPVRSDPYAWYVGRVWRYHRGGQNPSIQKGQKTNYKMTSNNQHQLFLHIKRKDLIAQA
jgi:hypothetical protein